MHVIADFNLQGILANFKQKKWWKDNYSQKLYKSDWIISPNSSNRYANMRYHAAKKPILTVTLNISHSIPTLISKIQKTE